MKNLNLSINKIRKIFQRKYSPTKDITQKTPYDKEHAWIKYPGENLKYVVAFSIEDAYYPDRELINKICSEHDNKKYTRIHTHPSYGNNRSTTALSPSLEDIEDFLSNPKIKTEIIVPRNSETGEVYGYLFLKKTEKTPRHFRDPLIYEYDKVRLSKPRKEILPALQKLAKGLNLKYRFVPAKGYKFDKESVEFTKKGSLKRKSLDNLISGILILGAFSLIIYLLLLNQSIITGNVIANKIITNKTLFGSIISVLGLLVIFLGHKIWIWREKQK